MVHIDPRQIHFPHCWNGVDAYLENNAHVSYPIGDPENGPCPSDFPNVIPHLFMESECGVASQRTASSNGFLPRSLRRADYYHPSAFIGDEYEWYPGCFVL